MVMRNFRKYNKRRALDKRGSEFESENTASENVYIKRKRTVAVPCHFNSISFHLSVIFRSKRHEDNAKPQRDKFCKKFLGNFTKIDKGES